MVSSINTVGAFSGAVTPPAPAASAVSGSSASFAAAAVSPPVGTGADASFTPRIIQDPTAGFITQYLSANGSEVVSQTPSAITVAYLRQGLTASGLPKASPYASVGTTA